MQVRAAFLLERPHPANQALIPNKKIIFRHFEIYFKRELIYLVAN
jgi:hypothetical protein